MMSQSPNPYESPKQPSAVRLVKAGISSLTILVLMPVAMFVAFCIGCGVTVISIDGLLQSSASYEAMLLFAIIVSWGPPIGVMIAMLLWRRRVRRRELAAGEPVEPHKHAQN